MKSRPVFNKAFTLVELLVVVGIITIVASISMAGLSGLNRTAEYADAGNSVLGRMHMARQIAIARNTPVEVRFYQSDEFGRSSNDLWQAMSIVIPATTEDESDSAEGEMYFLPSVLAFDDSPTYSSLLDGVALPEVTDNDDVTESQPLTDSDSIYAQMEGKDYTVFKYLPDGSTNLTLDEKWFLTIREKQQILAEDDELQNFSTIILNPHTGRGTIYRP